MVFNEWGAVIKHQDEMDQALKKAEKERQKETQIRYKNDLEEQKEDQRRKILENQMRDAELGNDVMRFQALKA
jgi:hypothetical protein